MHNNSMNHYETLGVAKNASVDDIKKAYRKLASQNHPDKGGDTAKFQSIQAAYATLEDANKRAQYDDEISGRGRQQFQFRSGGGMPQNAREMEDILNHLRGQFGAGPFGGSQNRAPRNKDIKIRVALSLEDTLTEQDKTLSITQPNGKNENVDIKIPRGISHGATIRYPGLGDHSLKDVPRGDLYVQCFIQPHAQFEVVGIDLISTLTVNCIEAMVGCEKEIKGLDGKTYMITIPPGSQFNSKFGMAEQGLYSAEHPGRGRLIINLEIYIPKKLTDDQIKILKDMQVTI